MPSNVLHLYLQMNITLSTSLDAYECLRAQINPYAEELWIFALNAHLELIKMEMLFRGTADFCVIHPRDIFRFLILHNATSFIMAHNHPSNHCQPSDEDIILTRKIHQIGLLFQIPLNDHIIATADSYYSMADHGHFKRWRKSLSLKALY